MAFKGHRPTGATSWPLILVAGAPKTGKSYTVAELTGSDLIGETFWIEFGEPTAEEYGQVPGARYILAEHDGTFNDVLTSNNVYESIREVLRPGGSYNYSWLEHRWTFSVQAGTSQNLHYLYRRDGCDCSQSRAVLTPESLQPVELSTFRCASFHGFAFDLKQDDQLRWASSLAVYCFAIISTLYSFSQSPHEGVRAVRPTVDQYE